MSDLENLIICMFHANVNGPCLQTAKSSEAAKYIKKYIFAYIAYLRISYKPR